MHNASDRRESMGEGTSTLCIGVPQSPAPDNAYCIRKHGRAFAIYDPAGVLVCVTVYLKGAREVVRRLGGSAVYVRK